jgi:pre-rRNA-processing protein TSR2
MQAHAQPDPQHALAQQVAAAVRAIFDRWTALQLAVRCRSLRWRVRLAPGPPAPCRRSVALSLSLSPDAHAPTRPSAQIDHEWGGDQAGQRVAAFTESVCNLILRSSRVYYDQIADLLDAELLEAFATQAEDDSVEEVTERLLAMHDEFRAGHAPTAAAVLAETSAGSAARLATLAQCRGLEAPSEIESDLDSQLGNGDAMDEDDEPVPLEQGRQRAPVLPVVDEDGFELVQPKGRRR